MKLLLLTIILLLTQTSCVTNSAVATQSTEIIPQPLSMTVGEGNFTINQQTSLIYDKEVEKVADYLRLYIPLKGVEGNENNSIRLVLDSSLGEEAYTLSVDEKGIEIRGGDYGGVFNGVQSLLQLLPHSVYGKNATLPMEVSYVKVEDAPQHHYRGQLLDVARTFQPVDEVKRIIDYMAYLKLNKLHFHLIDDQSWRIELKKYPHFTEVGGFRGGDSPVPPIYGSFDKKYGGYYTQDELRDIVAYAAERNIEVIPEIDMPGHSRALGMIHPAIRCNYTPDTSSTNGLDIRNVWCVAKESNYELIEDIVKELVDIFPSEYLHIGGDEVRFAQWNGCPDCQKLIKDKGLTGGEQLEQYFLNRVCKILAKHNRKPMVWDEAIYGGLLTKSALVCGWRNKGKGWQAAVKNGYKTIVMPSSAFYLDKRQSPHDRGHRSPKGLSLKTICDFSMEDATITAEQRKHIVGVEGAFWSEIYLANITPDRHFSDYIEYMFFPRIFGVSEVGWSKERRSYEDMLAVLRGSSYHKLNAMGATFRLESPVVKVVNEKLIASVDDGSTLYYKDIRTNKVRKYRHALDAADAPFILFQSRLMTGYSEEIGAKEFYKTKTPKCEITSSMTLSTRYPIERWKSYQGPAYTVRCAKKGDWVQITFEEPVESSYIKVTTGYEHLYRALIYNGHLEVCYDGEEFVREGDLCNGIVVLQPKNKPIHALRIVADDFSEADGKVIIQPLIIK